jgi:hypothetical protein
MNVLLVVEIWGVHPIARLATTRNIDIELD